MTGHVVLVSRARRFLVIAAEGQEYWAPEAEWAGGMLEARALVTFTPDVATRGRPIARSVRRIG